MLVGCAGKYHVNFQLKLLELLREARALGRIGIDVPEAARLALRQEEKFRGYYDRLDHLLLVSSAHAIISAETSHHDSILHCARRRSSGATVTAYIISCW